MFRQVQIIFIQNKDYWLQQKNAPLLGFNNKEQKIEIQFVKQSLVSQTFPEETLPSSRSIKDLWQCNKFEIMTALVYTQYATQLWIHQPKQAGATTFSEEDNINASVLSRLKHTKSQKYCMSVTEKLTCTLSTLCR